MALIILFMLQFTTCTCVSEKLEKRKTYSLVNSFFFRSLIPTGFSQFLC